MVVMVLEAVRCFCFCCFVFDAVVDNGDVDFVFVVDDTVAAADNDEIDVVIAVVAVSVAVVTLVDGVSSQWWYICCCDL